MKKNLELYRVDDWNRSHVPLKGQTLDRVLWQGAQWAVTDYGLECRDGTYAIGADRLLQQEDTYPWPRHMAEKKWVDGEDFLRAFEVAKYIHFGREIAHDH